MAALPDPGTGTGTVTGERAGAGAGTGAAPNRAPNADAAAGRENQGLPGQPPLLSILIPAFNQPAGVARIFEQLQPLRGRAELEIVVSDDSSDDAAAALISATCASFPNAVYRRQAPSLGAVVNWNWLLDQARGRYSWLLHHDEAPADGAALARGLPLLTAADAPDIWVLACQVVRRPGGPERLHFPPRWGAALLQRWPGYLLRRNVIGPPSALIVRSRCYARFEPRLAWLVDVDSYTRSRQAARRVAPWPGPGVLSWVDGGGSITASLQSGLAATAQRERAWLRQTAAGRPAAAVWLSSAWPAAALRGLEQLAWAGWRGGQGLWRLWAGPSQ